LTPPRTAAACHTGAGGHARGSLSRLASGVHEVAHFGEEQPIGRPSQPQEIAPAFVDFAWEADSSCVTGEVLTLLGGETPAA
jgi:NAD(P)-dependent dehydrogenase (short-subunit alcohol dehydrogenase family)